MKMTDYEDSEETEETIYDEEGRQGLVDDGEISPQEAAFMQGYEAADEEEPEEDEDEDEDKKD